MSKELRNSAIRLVKETGLLELPEGPGIKEIQDLHINDLTAELEHTRVYRELVENLDSLMVIENSKEGDYESVKDELINSGRLAFLTNDHEPTDEEILKYLKHLQQVRRLVYDSATMTLPVLRSVHQVDGLPVKEAGIAATLEKRDELTDQIIQLHSEIRNNQKRLSKLILSNITKFETSKQLTSLLIETKNGSKIESDPKQKKDLEKKLSIAKEKSYDLAEQIQAFIVENGLNWAEDEYLRDIVLYCGEMYSS